MVTIHARSAFPLPCRRLLQVGSALLLLNSFTALAQPLTLPDAQARAQLVNPALRSAFAALPAIEGQLKDARAPLWNNPQIGAEWALRRIPQVTPGERQWEWNASLSQTFETGGQQQARRNEASSLYSATHESLEEARVQLTSEVEQRFVRALGLQFRIQTESETLALVEETAGLIGKRVRAGEDSRLEGNFARVEAERAQNQVAALREQLIQARADLATLLQLDPDTLPEVAGNLDPGPPRYTLEELTASAAARPALRSLQYRENAAQSRLELERAAIYPDVTLGIGTGREGPLDARERITGLTLSVPLPVFRRNATGIGKAATELTQVQIEREAAIRDARAQVVALWARLGNLRSRVDRLTSAVLPVLQENQRLSRTAFRAGEIALPQLLLVNRQVVDSRRDLIEARTELRLTQIALERAAGWNNAGDSK